VSNLYLRAGMVFTENHLVSTEDNANLTIIRFLLEPYQGQNILLTSLLPIINIQRIYFVPCPMPVLILQFANLNTIKEHVYSDFWIQIRYLIFNTLMTSYLRGDLVEIASFFNLISPLKSHKWDLGKNYFTDNQVLQVHIKYQAIILNFDLCI